MKIQLIRNATMKITYAGRTFLTDPMLAPKDEIDPFLEQAEEISPDPKDTVYLALCLAINSNFWSNDKKLKENQDLVEVLTTEEIINKVSSLKDEKDLEK